MYPLLESIRIQDGIIQNIDYHQQRVNISLQVIGHQNKSTALLDLINIPEELSTGIVKCRFLYGAADDYSIHFTPYHKREIKLLHLINGKHLQYALKWANRDDINKLMKGMPSREDILITVDDQLTDTSYCNVAFNGAQGWITPEFPLLKGTQRALLLNSGVLKTGNIKKEDLSQFTTIRLFNAMIPWDEAIELDINCIIY
ncbi:MAG TPA: aminotransferase class IV [Saprospiraceae bacterium]|nr:aminotransferase class IV [Saprospiraceae bacterium]